MALRLLRSSIAIFALAIATPAFAASITVDQRSPVANYGTWAITPPTGNQIRSYGREQRRVIGNLPAGELYSFYVDAPDGATATIRLMENGATLESITGERISFSMTNTTSLTIQVAYTYQGKITVESIPSGAPFELTAPNGMRFTGVTPQEYRELAPGSYSAYFGLRAGCNVPRPIRRSLSANEEIVFLGEYHCGSASSSSRMSSSSRSSSVSSSSSSSVAARARVIHSMQQKEVLPGGTVRVTVGFVNISRSTLYDLMFQETFDPSVISLESLPSGAVLQGNTIFWSIPQVYAGQRWSSNLLLKVASDAVPGRTSLTARLSGDALNGAAQGPLSDIAILGVATLPATGGAFDVLLSFLGLLLPAPVLARIRRK